MKGHNSVLAGSAALALAFTAFGLGSYATLLMSPAHRQDIIRIHLPSGISCDQPRNREESDLCAQWLAAQANQNSAILNWWQVVFTALGTIGLLITLWFNRNALRLSREAVTDARQSLLLAREELEITRDSSRRQLRAYLTVKDCTVDDLEIGMRPCVKFDVINTGQTPANKVKLYNFIDIVPDPYLAKVAFSALEESDIGPGRSMWIRQAAPVICSKKLLNNITSGKMHLICFGFITYVDAFGFKRRVLYKYILPTNLASIAPRRLAIWGKGNKST